MDISNARPRSPAADPIASLARRLDGVHMNAAEREHAKRDLRAAEHAVDTLVAAIEAVRGWLGAPRAPRLQPR